MAIFKNLIKKYNGILLQQKVALDFVCLGTILVEIKVVSELANALRTQVINYLEASQLPLGMLINFGRYPRLEYEPYLLNTGKKKISLE